MIDLAHLFRDSWAWSLDQAEPWHNWAAHGLIAASFGLVIGVIAKAFGAPFGVGPWTAASYYVLRESEELMLAWGFPASIDWKDHLLDAGVPVVCSLIVYLVSLLIRYRAGSVVRTLPSTSPEWQRPRLGSRSANRPRFTKARDPEPVFLPAWPHASASTFVAAVPPLAHPLVETCPSGSRA
jgi:hypothetical protein